MLDSSLEKAHAQATEHGGGIASAFAGAAAKIAMVAVGAGISAAVIADELYKMGAPYEQLLNQIQAFTHSSNAQIQSLSSYLYQISPQLAKYGLTSEDAADAVAKLTKAGLSLNEAQAAVLPTLTLAKAGMIDAGAAANFVAEAMNVWGLKASDVTMISNALVGASHSSTASVEDLGNSLSFSAAAAAKAGLSYQQTAAFLAEVANAGVQGSKAGTALKDILVNMEVPTSAASKAMKSLGIDVFNSQGKMKDFGSILGMLHDKLSGLSEQQEAMYVKDIFGKIPMESALTIIKGGLPAYQKYLALVSRTGEAADIAAAKSGGLSGAIARTGAQFESMGQALYLKVAPVFTKIVNGFADDLPKLGGLASKASSIISGVFHNIGGGGGLSIIGRTLTDAFKDVGPLLKSEMSSLNSIFDSAKAQGVFQAIGAALKSVVGLIDGTVLPAFRQFIGFIVKDIEPPAVDIFEHKILPAVKAFAEFISGTLVPKVRTVLDALKPLVAFAESFIAGKLVPLISWAITQLKPVFVELGGVISSLLDFLAPFVRLLTPIIEWLVNILAGPAISAVKGFFNGVVRVISGLLTILKGVLDFLTGVFTGNWSKAWHGITEIFSGLLNVLIGAAKVLIFGKFLKIFIDGFAAIGDAFSAGGKLLEDGLEGLGKFILNFFKAETKDQLKIIVDGWKLLADAVSTGIKAVINFVAGGWRDVVSDTVSFGRNLIAEGTKAFNELVSTVVVKMADFLEAVVNGGEKILTWFGRLPGVILGALRDAGSWLISAGGDIIDGLVKGIESKADSAVKAITGVGSKIVSGFKKVMGIFSPSRVFSDFGVNTMEGYNQGVVSMTSKVQAAMNKMGAILPNVSGHKSLQAALGSVGLNVSSVPGLTSGSALAGAYGSASGMPNVTVNVAGHVTTEKDLAKSIATTVRDQIRQIARKNGGSTGLN